MNALSIRLLAALTAPLLAFAPLAARAQATPDDPSYVHTAVQGDTLIGLSRRLLVQPKAWPELARINAVRNPNRIPVGTELRIPLRLMRVEAANASVLGVVGDVKVAGQPLAAGQALAEGTEIVTGPDGHASVRLVDGTLLRLRPGSSLVLRESRRLRDVDTVQSGASLQRGRVEVEAAPAAAGKPGFKIETPQGVLGVRGTEFRVAAAGALANTRGEVLGGVVAFGGLGGVGSGSPPAAVGAGFGTVIDASGQVAVPVKLLDAPELGELPALQDRILVRLALPPLENATAYRAQVSLDATFDRVVADLTSATPELRFADLADAEYVLRVRGVDKLGLEGRNADHRFKLKARPEAPLPSSPPPKAVSFGGRVELAWTANAEAASYRLRLASSADFKPALRDITGLRELSTTFDGLAPGTYFWQLASVRADGDQGPFGDPRSFELRPLPPQPPPPKVGERGISLAWEGRPGQTFELQLARDAAFKQIVLERTLSEPQIELPLPGSGRFYLRLRARDPDGFIGPYTTPQFFDVPNCLRDGSGQCVRATDQPLLIAP